MLRGEQTGVSLYRRCYLDLLRRIELGEFGPDDRLPTEEELCRDYRVSLITVRRALAELTRSGIAHRRHGLGTFVIRPRMPSKSLALMGPLDSVMSYSKGVTHRILNRRVNAALPSDMTRQFDIGAAPMEQIDVLYARDLPFAHTSIFVSRTIGVSVDDASIEQDRVSIFHLLEDKSGVSIAHVDQMIDVVSAPKAVAYALAVTTGCPMQRALRAYYSHEGRVIYSAMIHYHPQNFKISMRFIP
jgi:GntR family transcriptional regulator